MSDFELVSISVTSTEGSFIEVLRFIDEEILRLMAGAS